MSTEYKLGAAAVGLIVLLGTIVMFATQPKNEKSGLPFDKPTSGSSKTTLDKTVTPAPTGGVAKPSAPTIPQAKLSGAPSKSGSSTSIESPVSGQKPEPSPTVVATAPPARRQTDPVGDTPPKASDSAISPEGRTPLTAGTGSGSAGTATPGLTPPSGNAPTVSTPTTGEPGRPTVSPSPGVSTPGGTTPPTGGSTTPPVAATPPKGESAKPGPPARPTVYDTEIEPRPSSVADLSGRSSPVTRTNPADLRSGTGEMPLKPTGGSTEAARKPATDAKPIAGQPYKIQPGDRLSTIAREKYGDASFISLIKQANPGMDENRIYAGSTIILPDNPNAGSNAASGTTDRTNRTARQDSPAGPGGAAKPVAGSAKPDGDAKLVGDISKPASSSRNQPDAGASSHVVRRGDTLGKIAKAKLGDENRWREILALNKDLISNADALEIGMTLRLPAPEKPAETKPRPRSR